MTCPMYKDFTRQCIQHFKEMARITNFEICESNKYEECPAYQIY